MRFLSLFSGIEAASVAWLPLEWECVGVAEIEPFPSAVLRHHYPDVPNLGDVSRITEDDIRMLGHIDLIIGGFPCQDLSVAGKRKGLRDTNGVLTRSGLFFEAMRLVRLARPHCGLRWLVLENVPGIYSSNGGHDFAAMVGEVVGCGFGVPGRGWENTGVAVGPDGQIEWTTLDAQWFGLAQRRKRMFAVADFGDWTSRGPILFIPESLRGHPAPRREKGERVAGATGISAAVSSGRGWWDDADVGATIRAQDSVTKADTLIAGTLNANGKAAGSATQQDAECGLLVTHALRPDGFDASEDGTGRGTPLVPVQPYTLAIRGRAGGHNLEYRQDGTANAALTPNGGRAGIGVGAIAFDCKASGQSGFGVGSIAGTQRAMGHADSHTNGGGHQAAVIGSAVRRLTPHECCRLQGFPDAYLDILYRGKPAADGPKYKALGNSMAVPVVRWIGRRIAAVNALSGVRSAA